MTQPCIGKAISQSNMGFSIGKQSHLIVVLHNVLSLVDQPHWSAVAQRLQEGLLSYTANMPPVREANPYLQEDNLAIEKAKEGRRLGWRRQGISSWCPWAQSLWLECWKDRLVSVINGSELRGCSEGEACVARMCNLNAQYSKVFNESRALI